MAIISGTHATETLIGTDGFDVLEGLGGSNLIDALGAGDTISGGDGATRCGAATPMTSSTATAPLI